MPKKKKFEEWPPEAYQQQTKAEEPKTRLVRDRLFAQKGFDTYEAARAMADKLMPDTIKNVKVDKTKVFARPDGRFDAVAYGPQREVPLKEEKPDES